MQPDGNSGPCSRGGPLTWFLALVLALFAVAPVLAEELVLVHTNDLHGQVWPRRYTGDFLPREDLGRPLGSLFSAPSYLEKLRSGALRFDPDGPGLVESRRRGSRGRASGGREKPAGVLFLDAGDWFGGTLYGEATRGKAIAEVLVDPALGLDATTYGNHAWDFGTPALWGFLGVLRDRVPVVCANSVYQGKPTEEPYRVFEVAGRRIGVLGLVTDGALRAASREHTRGWSMTDEVETLRRYLPELREKCDYVVLLAHVGYGRDGRKRGKLDRLDDGHPELNVDLVVDGHSHRVEQVWADEDSFVCQAGFYGVHLGEIRIPLLPGGRFGKPRARCVVMDTRVFPTDPGMEKRLGHHLEARGAMEDEVLIPTEPGLAIPHLLRTDTEHLDSQMGNLVCRAFLRSARLEGHPVDFAVAYQNGVRSGLYAADGGGITAGGLHAMGPFGQPIEVVEMPGELFRDKALSRAFLTRNRMSFGDAFMVARELEPGGKRELVSFQVDGRDFDPRARVRVVMGSFQASWFRGPGVTHHVLRDTPKQAVLELLLSRSRGKPVTRDLVRKLAPPSAKLIRAAEVSKKPKKPKKPKRKKQKRKRKK